MKKLILHMITSIDGFIADRDGNVNPETHWDEEMQKFYVDLFNSVDAVVYGRGIFEQYIGHWGKVATGAIPPANNIELKWTQRLAGMQKYVVSDKLKKADYNTKIIRGEIGDEVTKLKKQAHGDLLLICGPKLFAELTARGLVDEYILYVCPNALGQGTHLFRDIPDYIPLKFERTVPFTSGINMNYYAPVYR